MEVDGWFQKEASNPGRALAVLCEFTSHQSGPEGGQAVNTSFWSLHTIWHNPDTLKMLGFQCTDLQVLLFVWV